MKKQIKVEQENVKIKVDFETVWAFVWRFYVIAFGIAFTIGMLTTIATAL